MCKGDFWGEYMCKSIDNVMEMWYPVGEVR